MKDTDIEVFNSNETNNDVSLNSESNTSESFDVSSKDTLNENTDSITLEKVDDEKEENNNKEELVKIKSSEDDKITSNVYDNQVIEIKEGVVLQGDDGSTTIGKIDGESIVATGKAMPSPIDITIKKKATMAPKQKKIRVITKKDRILSIIGIVFTILIIGALGYGGYFYFYLNNPNLFEVKNLTFELGEELPVSASYYVTSPFGVDDMDYDLDLSQVANFIGNYTYSVTHEGVTKMGMIIIKDTVAPVITINSLLNFERNSNITVEDLATCDDLSGCTLKLGYEIYTEYAGEQNAEIIATDSNGNEAKEEIKVRILDIAKTIVCKSKEIDGGEKYTYTDEYTLNFDSEDNLVTTSGLKRFKYKAGGYSDYMTLYYDKLNDTSGTYYFYREDFSYTMVTTVNTNNLTNQSELIKYFQDGGFICK